MTDQSTPQAIAFLFKAGNALDVAVESSPAPHGFSLENSERGAEQLAEKLVPLRDMTRAPCFCVGVAPGAKFEGVLAEELTSAPVPIYMMAQEVLADFTRRNGLSAENAQSLLLAYREQLPKVGGAI
jgi:hypothetical protein